jgi:hypothetical protein
MSQKLLDAIEEVKTKIAAKEEEINPLRIVVNQLCKIAGIAEEYPDVSEGVFSGGSKKTPSLSWRLDQFFNRPLSTCVGEILEERKKIGLDGPATVDEIYLSLCAGGFKFEGNGSEENSKRALKISLTKNTAQFSKVKDDVFGLKKWYSARPARRSTQSNAGNQNESTDDEASLDTGLEEETKATLEENNEDVTPQ